MAADALAHRFAKSSAPLVFTTRALIQYKDVILPV